MRIRSPIHAGDPAGGHRTAIQQLHGSAHEADQTTVDEGETATFTLHRHGGKPDAMSRPLHVNVEVTQRGDYISGATPETVTFLADQATTTLSLPTSNDSTDKPNGAITAKILEADSYADDEYAYLVSHYPRTPWDIYSATTAVTDDDDPCRTSPSRTTRSTRSRAI